MQKKPHFHEKSFALGLVLRVRVFGTRKWPIKMISIYITTPGAIRLVTGFANVPIYHNLYVLTLNDIPINQGAVAFKSYLKYSSSTIMCTQWNIDHSAVTFLVAINYCRSALVLVSVA